MQARTERFELRLDHDILDRIDDWRSDQPDLPSRSEAVRRLVNAGLGSPQHLQLYHLARFSLLCAARAADLGKAIHPAYAYAWHAGVYPLFNDAAELHRPFAEQFDIPREKIEELAKLLDKAWLEKTVPSFYKLETYYDVRGGRGFWDRMKLIHACRYMFLNDLFDDMLWNSLLRGSDHPTEAKSITRKFDHSDIYLT